MKQWSAWYGKNDAPNVGDWVLVQAKLAETGEYVEREGLVLQSKKKGQKVTFIMALNPQLSMGVFIRWKRLIPTEFNIIAKQRRLAK